jgi:dienelactone hydrolase
MMNEVDLTYQVGDAQCEGYLVFDESIKTPRPAVIVAHAWYGQDDFARDKARELAEIGYIGFAADLFGNRKNASSDEEAGSLIHPLYANRDLLQKRIIATFDTIAKQPMVDKSRIGAIGFCFGGLTVIELLRSGTPVKSVVSFHGVLGNSGAQTVPIAQNIHGSLLILHGYEDPLVSSADVLNIQKELNDAGVDWQMNIYGHTSHAFTNPKAHDKVKGMIYNEKTKDRAWLAMQDFFAETLYKDIGV